MARFLYKRAGTPAQGGPNLQEGWHLATTLSLQKAFPHENFFRESRVGLGGLEDGRHMGMEQEGLKPLIHNNPR
jgi:hypothetical protein